MDSWMGTSHLKAKVKIKPNLKFSNLKWVFTINSWTILKFFWIEENAHWIGVQLGWSRVHVCPGLKSFPGHRISSAGTGKDAGKLGRVGHPVFSYFLILISWNFEYLRYLIPLGITFFKPANNLQCFLLIPDAVYVLCYSLILLSIDLTSPHVKNKMSKREFIRNTRRAAQNISEDFVGHLYDNIYLIGHVAA